MQTFMLKLSFMIGFAVALAQQQGTCAAGGDCRDAEGGLDANALLQTSARAGLESDVNGFRSAPTPLFARVDADNNNGISPKEFKNALGSGIIEGRSTMPPPTLPPPGSPSPAMPTPGPQIPPRTPAAGVVVGQPYICGAYMNGAGFHGRRCYCNGDVYYGKKFKSGKSGPLLTFKEMTTMDGGWKDWRATRVQRKGSKMKPWKDLKKSSSHYPAYSMTFCGGCNWFNDMTLYGGPSGDPKHCWCMPKAIATTPPPTTPRPHPTYAPAPYHPPPGDNPWGR